MSDQPATTFDEWYTALNASDRYDATVASGLELAPGLRATGLVSGPAFAEVLQILALRPGELLLDLACGRGGYGLAAVEAVGARLVGVDFSPVALATARATAEQRGVSDRASFVVGELAATGLEEASVDAVLCLDSIQFATPTGAAVEECRRVLVPGGRLVITCWEAGAAGGPDLPGRIRELNLESTLRDGGFDDVTVAERPDWLERERRHWEAVLRVDPADDAGLQALRAEGGDMLPLLPQMRRVLATATAPA